VAAVNIDNDGEFFVSTIGYRNALNDIAVSRLGRARLRVLAAVIKSLSVF
jgi:hypothetical protein